MNLFPEMLRHARRNLALLLLLGIAGAAAVAVTANRLKNARLENVAAQADLRASAARLAHARDERQDRLRQLETYRAMRDLGYVGEERPTRWIERIRAAGERHGLFEVRPSFSGMRVIAGKSGSETVVRGMTLRMQLLHENDLLDFLDDLRRSAPAHLRLRRCDVVRLDAGGEAEAALAQLGAECSVEWITWRAGTESPS